MKFETLQIEKSDEGVLTMTLNRPERANAINGVMHDEIHAFLLALTDERDVGAVVLTGAGRFFSAGGDVSLMEETRDADAWAAGRMIDNVSRLVRDFLDVSPPIVAAVNGPALGLGATLALLSDIVVMGRSATISDPHVRMGLVAGDGGAAVWSGLIGPARAKEYLLTGDSVDAVTAERIGLVNRVVPDDQVLKEAHAFAARLATGPRRAIAMTKRTINAAQAAVAVPNTVLAASFEARSVNEPDMGEGIAAFRERRAPVWPSANGSARA